MAENTAIEWADHTFNPWIGCTKVGPGCDHCYAADLSATRLGVPWGAGQPRRHTAASTWNAPHRWNARAARLGIRYRVFCASLADVFDNEVPAAWRNELFHLIRSTPHLDWLLVTKRIGNAAKMAAEAGGWPKNVWLGATIVNQAEADRDIPKLLDTRGPRFRFLSMEPLLGPVDLTVLHYDGVTNINALSGRHGIWFGAEGPALDWVIVGGESGRDARPLHFTWAQSLRDQCAAAGVPFLFKQWGEWAPICSLGGELIDSLFQPAPAHDPEAIRRCKVDQLVMHNDGETFPLSGWSAQLASGSRLMFQAGFDAMTMFAVGKKRAGRLLDHRTHDEVPA